MERESGNSSSTPLVSVFMVTYNHEKYLAQSLQSVLDQVTNFHFEIIIGEDNSTDSTRSVLKDFEKRYPQIIKPVYHDKNVGAYRNAYEFCYPLLSGKYIACLEGDDYWSDNNKLQMQVDVLEKNPDVSICFTKVDYWNQSSSAYEENWLSGFIKKNRLKFIDILERNMITTASALFRNVLPALPHNFSKFPFSDWPLFLFLLTYGDAIYLNQVTAVYRLHHTGSFSGLNVQTQNLMSLQIYEQLLKYPELAKFKKEIQRYVSERAYIAYCYEIKNASPSKEQALRFSKIALQNVNASNIFYPAKTLLQKLYFELTGTSLGKSTTS